MTDFIIVRHGETDWNRQQRFQGQIDVPLNATGLQQAQHLALVRRQPLEQLALMERTDVQPWHGGEHCTGSKGRRSRQAFPHARPGRVIGPRQANGRQSDMTDFVFIRHGETDWNRQQRFQGQIDVPLNATGHTQAARLRDRLAAERAEALACSDLERARQTAAPLAAAWQVEPMLHTGLREQSFGVLEGLDVPTIQSRHPDLWAHWLEHRADFALPGGESLRQFHTRVLQAVRQSMSSTPPCVTTASVRPGWRSASSRTANGLPLDGLRNCEIPNTGVNRLRWKAGTLEILRWADAEHLEGLPPQPSTAAGKR